MNSTPIMPPIVLAALLAALMCCWACDDAVTDPANGPGTDAQDAKRLLSAGALDAAPGVLPNERTAAALNFWKPLSDRAVAVEEVAVVGSTSLDSPAAAVGLEKVFRAATADARGMTAEFAAGAVDVRRVELETGAGPPPRLERLVPSRGARLLRKPLLHPRSAPKQAANVPLLSRRRALSDDPAPPDAFAVYSLEPPSAADLTAAAARGAQFWIVGRERGESSAEDAQASRPSAIPGLEGNASLAIPVVFVPPAFHTAAMDTVNNANEHWLIDVRRAEPVAEPPSLLVARIRGHDPTRKVVVTCGRDPRPFPAGTGTSALELACILEVARTTLAVMNTPPNPRPAIDIEFVWVMDHGHGYDWLPALTGAGETIVGVVNVQDLVPRNMTSSDVLLTLDGTETYSALERAFHQTLTGLAGEEGLWARSGVTVGGAPVSAALAADCGQRRVPLVRLGAASTADDRDIRPSHAYPPAGPGRSVADPVHDLVFSSHDDVRRFARGHMAPQVSVARALAFGILRTTEAFAKRP